MLAQMVLSLPALARAQVDVIEEVERKRIDRELDAERAIRQGVELATKI